jgi:co-chaperonin GroES (HSP10)
MMALQRQVLSVLAAVLCLAAQSHVNALAGAPSRKFNGGAGMGRLVIDDLTGAQDAVSCHYDMVLVERIQGNPKKESGLFVPDADLPRLHLCRVLSMGTGREEENGTISPMPDIKIGDVVIAKNPWGIGPKDEETTSGKKLSFMRSQDIAAVITGGLTEESAKDTL